MERETLLITIKYLNNNRFVYAVRLTIIRTFIIVMEEGFTYCALYLHFAYSLVTYYVGTYLITWQ